MVEFIGEPANICEIDGDIYHSYTHQIPNFMNTLDNPNMIDPGTVPYAKKAMNQGLIASLVLIVLNLITSLTGLVEPGDSGAMSWIVNLITWGVIAYFIYAAQKSHRDDDLGGYISYGRAFSVGGIVLLAIAVITIVWSYIYFAFIDPDIFDTIREASLEQMINQQGMSEEDAERAMGMMDWMWTPGAMSLMAGIFTAIAGLIIDLIVSAVVKKDNPAFA